MSMDQTICLNPATGEELGRVPLQGPEDVVAAALAARQAQPEWAATPIKQRAKAIKKVRDYLADQADHLAETIARDNGKTRTDALVAEVLPATAAANYYAKKAAGWLKDAKPGPALWLLANKRTRLVRQPWGVVGIISPWNYPFSIPFSELACALLAGNCVLLKMASEAQMVAQAMSRCLAAAGLPPGVFTCLNLPGRQAGPAMLEAGVDKLFFTGSVGVGKQLMALAAPSLTPVNLELGGNDAMLVCPDADLKRAAAGAAWGGMINTGQTCGGVERVYVHHSVASEFLQLLGAKVKALRVGYDTDCNVDLGAMTTTRQVDLVKAHIADALAHGAKIFAQSACAKGANFLPATVLTQVDHSMRVMREETFGPVVAVMPVGNMGPGGAPGQRLRPGAHRLGVVPRPPRRPAPGPAHQGRGGDDKRPPHEPRLGRGPLGRFQEFGPGPQPRPGRLQRDDPGADNRERPDALGQAGPVVVSSEP